MAHLENMVNIKKIVSLFSLVALLLGFLVFTANSGNLDVLDTLFAGSMGILNFWVQPDETRELLEFEILYSDSIDPTGHFFSFIDKKNEALKKYLENEIQKSELEVSLALKDLESGEILLIHAEEMMHAASLMKVPVMIEVFRQAERGKFSLKDKIPVTNQFKSIVDGSIYSLQVADDSDEDIYRLIGKELSIRDLVEQMVTVSSNLATNILIELVGAKNVMETMEGIGINNMKVLRGVEDTKAYEKGLNNRTDALSMMQVMLSITEGKAGSPEACQEMIKILAQQKFRAKIPAGIPAGIKVANKTGSITRIDHDAAIVFPERQKPYILVVLTRGLEKHEDAERLISHLSKIIYDNLTKHKTR